MRHIISVLIENESGALSRVAGLFSARGDNIESLTVAPTPYLLPTGSSGTGRCVPSQGSKSLSRLERSAVLLRDHGHKKPAPVWRSDLPTERDPSEHPGESHSLNVPRSPFIGLLLRAVPPTGTEMEARPFGPDPEIATGATPEPLTRHGSGGFNLILAPPPFISLHLSGNHALAPINEVIGTIAAPGCCPVSPHPVDRSKHATACPCS